MKLYQQILMGTLLALFSTAFSEVTVKIISPEPGERIEPCRDVTFVAAVQTTDGEEIDRVFFYNRIKSNSPFGYTKTAPWEKEMEQIKSGNYCIIAIAQLTDKSQIASEPLTFAVGDSITNEERLYNPTFSDCGHTLQTPWGFHQYEAEGTAGFVRIPELGDCVKIDVKSPSKYNVGSHISIYQDVKLEKNHVYEISFLAYAPRDKIMNVDIRCRTGWLEEDHLIDLSMKMEGVQLLSKRFTISNLNVNKTYSLMIGAGLQISPVYIKWVSLKDVTTTSFVEKNPISVNVFNLQQAYPNPFNPATTIAYSLQRPGHVKLKVYNALGKDVAELVNDYQVEGSHSVLFDAQHLPTGIYLYQLQVDGEFSEMKKMLLLK